MAPPVRAVAGFGVAYRPMTDADLPFVAALYASTRADETAAFGWPAETQRAFLEQQHRAQHRHFQAAYPEAEWLIVEMDGTPIGRLYIDDRPSDLHGIDIALIPQCRGSGIGGAIVRDLTEHARSLGKGVTFYVEKNNAGAARLYRRLGFEAVGDEGVYERLRWLPDTPETGPG